MKQSHQLSLLLGAFLTILGLSLTNVPRTSQTSAQNTPINTAEVKLKSDTNSGGHVGANGVREVLLTGDNAAKATAAALAAVPKGTVLRVETDAEGSPYEAHMRKADGTQVTVKFDTSFKVTAVEEGKGV
ncbi:MAG: hypothetical protein WCT01_00235 [Candidatus Shapirobacteria bacterium]|jgi:hypothetical protein